MYRISTITANEKTVDSILHSPLWKTRSDFEYVGTLTDESNTIDFLKNTRTSMVFIDTDGRSPLEMPVIKHIKCVLPEVYIVLLSNDNSCKTVREGFISGIFDYMVIPFTNSDLEDVLLRLYSHLGEKYIFDTLNEAIEPIIANIETGCKDIAPYCNKAVRSIYKEYSTNTIAGFMVSEKVKTYIYDEILRKIPWLRQFTFKYNFIHSTGTLLRTKIRFVQNGQSIFKLSVIQ